MMPYLPGGIFATITWPANGDRVVPSASYFGHTGITPVIPVGLAVPSNPVPEFAEIGHASDPVTGSTDPAKAFDKGWLNSS